MRRGTSQSAAERLDHARAEFTAIGGNERSVRSGLAVDANAWRKRELDGHSRTRFALIVCGGKLALEVEGGATPSFI